jgi:uncharacterized protein YndB with AHSA1/START domain
MPRTDVAAQALRKKGERIVEKRLVAHADTIIDAPVAEVWDAFINPRTIKQYMFGTDVISDWKPGSPIVWKGEWQGRSYEDKGMILQLQPERLLQYTHFSPVSGDPDTPESYHTVTIELTQAPQGTHVSLAQDNNHTEQSREHSERNWRMMLTTLKTLLERSHHHST